MPVLEKWVETLADTSAARATDVKEAAKLVQR
jgi:hypothetical protein